MNSIDALMTRGMATATAFLGEPISIDGKPYTAVVSELRITREMAEAGFDPGYNLTAVISVAQMPVLPPTDQRTVPAMYKGRAYRLKDPSTIDAAAVTIYLQNNF